MVDGVRVGSLDFKISLQKPGSKYLVLDEGDCAGVVKYATQEIFLLNNMAEQYSFKVLLHEMVHAMLEQATHDQEIFDDEHTVEVISGFMLQIIRDNPTLIKDIWKACKVNEYSGD